jgi:glycolate oxidase
MDAAAVLLIELEGLVEAVEEQTEQIRDGCQRCGAREFRVAKSAEERDLCGRAQERVRRGGAGEFVVLRAGWRGAAHAGRADAAVHRRGGGTARSSHQQYLSRGRREPASDYSVQFACVPGELDRARAAGEDILNYCISVGGSITGEHGVGMEKNELMGGLQACAGSPEPALRRRAARPGGAKSPAAAHGAAPPAS